MGIADALELDLGVAPDTKMGKEEARLKEEAAYSALSVKTVMDSKVGRHFVWELLSDCRVFHDGFNENPIVLARNTGVRTAGLMLLNKVLAASPTEYELMFAEHKYVEEEND